jgi:hypothetical protein
MPTKTELESEVAILRAKLASLPPANYMQRVSPNLIVLLHYAGKALWLVLAAAFGFIGFQLYAIGVQAPGNATASLPLGISFSLQGAGPGLVVMVIALLCSLVGAVKAKVELTPEAIRLMAPAPEPDRRSDQNTRDEDVADVDDTATTQWIENLNTVWGLTEVAQLYRTPVAELVSEREAAEIAQLRARKPVPEGWAEEVCALMRASTHFNKWLRVLPSRDLPALGGEKVRVDSTLPWCVRLRWGGGVGNTVDVFVCATPGTTGRVVSVEKPV